MKSRIMYIEHKSGQSDRGKAWIGKVEFSKSGQTIYFNGLAFKKMTGTAFAYSEYSNYYDLENREAYWISGIKRNGQDRHWAGGGKVMIDRSIAQEYLSKVDFDILDSQIYELVDIQQTDKSKFAEMENERLK
jgi:hypothetical protein